MRDGNVGGIIPECSDELRSYDSFKKVMCLNLNFYMIHTSDGFAIIEHRERPMGNNKFLPKLLNFTFSIIFKVKFSWFLRIWNH